MNSLTDKEFDEKLDRMLGASVGPGAEPAGFTLDSMPPRRSRPWGLVCAISAAVGLVAVLLFSWILSQPMDGITERTSQSGELSTMLTESIVMAVERLTASDMLVYVAVVMAAVYAYFGSRFVRLYRSC